jgi:hypothetical protein
MLLGAASLALGAVQHATFAAPPANWDQRPYRMHVTLAVDATARPQSDLEETVRQGVADRVAARIGPLWSLELEVAKDPAARRFCRDPRELDWDSLPTRLHNFDKLTWLSVVAAPQGYILRGREFDAYTRRAGPMNERLVQQASFLPDAVFQLLTDVFAPLAVVRTIEGKENEVELVFRGQDLPRPTDEELFVSAGDAYLPLLRRTDRSGKLLEEGGIVEIPYTLLTAEAADKNGWTAAVHSGMRIPFGAKRRGLVEQLAVALKNPHAPSRVRFHARTDKKRGLAGYEVFRDRGKQPPQLIGVTDRDGIISAPPGDGAVSMLLLRSEGALLARVPVAAGAAELLDTPIADDNARLAAQAEARVVREELIDVVARRTIMMARVRAMLKAGRVDDAERLMSELDELPTASVFAGAIDAAARRLPKSDDPQVQRAIDRLFASTRQLLSRYLDPRAVTTLENEVNAAQRGG